MKLHIGHYTNIVYGKFWKINKTNAFHDQEIARESTITITAS